MSLPTTPWVWTNIQVQGRLPTSSNEAQTAQIQSVTPEYFHTLKIPLRRGRTFTIQDNTRGAAPVAIINENFALRFWPSYPNENPIGQFISEGADKSAGQLEIVGVVSNVREGGLAFDAGPEFYVPTAVHPFQTPYLVVRTQNNPLLLINPIRAQVLSIDLDQPISDVKVMQALYDAGMGPRRLTMVLLGSFAGIALFLAAIGLYGIIAYSVQQRTQEFGIRQALGAQTSDVLGLVLSQTMRLVFAGLLVGIGGAFCLTRIMANLFFQVSPTDPSAFVASSLLFIAVALAAGYIPARRATQIDPMSALRVT